MPSAHIVMKSPVVETPRVQQLLGLFDVAPSPVSEIAIQADLPIEGQKWHVGLIVGRSGAGKSTVARELFGQDLIDGYDWPGDKSIVDGFPAGMGIKDITGLLSSVGFSSPPSWLRPFRCLSNGEQFRVTMARALADTRDVVVVDEFTSVIDRTVAQIGSAAIAKAVRRMGRKFIAVACHYDIVEWLDPDWVFEPEHNRFTWRRERQRPPIRLSIVRVHHSAWKLFKRYHYLTGSLAHSATCFVALFRGLPVAFCSTIHNPHSKFTPDFWREHRTVCLPDFQGVGIGNALSEFVASLMTATGKKFCSTTGSPSMIAHRLRSSMWKMHRKPGMTSPPGKNASAYSQRRLAKAASDRITAGFTFVGPVRRIEAIGFGIVAQANAPTNSAGTSNKLKRPAQAKPGATKRGLASCQQSGPTAKGSSATSASGTISTKSTTATNSPAGTSSGRGIPNE